MRHSQHELARHVTDLDALVRTAHLGERYDLGKQSAATRTELLTNMERRLSS